MQATLHRFTLERISADHWQGSLYESKRTEVMASHGFVSIPAHLRDARSYQGTTDVLSGYSPEAREMVMSALEEAA